MTYRVKLALIFVLILSIAMASGYFGVRFRALIKCAPEKFNTCSWSNPIYSQYSFVSDCSVIDLGIQPLAIPGNTLPEVMKHDRVLARELASRGRTLRFHNFLNGGDINSFLERGDLEVFVDSDISSLAAAAKLDAFFAALLTQNFSSVVSRRLWWVEDLAGRRVGFSPGSTAHYALLRALGAAGLSVADIEMVPMQFHEMPGAMAADKIDAFSASEPIPAMALKSLNSCNVTYRSLCSSYLGFSRGFLKNSPEESRIIVAGLVRALRWIRVSRENLIRASLWNMAAARDFGKTGGVVIQDILTAEDNAALIEQGISSLMYIPMISKKEIESGGALQGEFGFLKKLGEIDASSSWEKVISNFDRKLISEVAKCSEKYRLDEFDYTD